MAIELSVRLSAGYERTDADIAMAAERAQEWNALVPANRISLMTEKGWVTLYGEVEWEYQRRAAERAVRNLLGVTGVSNLVAVNPKIVPVDVERKIHDALVRQGDRQAKQIGVVVDGPQVTLEGKVHSWGERLAAQGAAWSAPGVTRVVNNLHVES